MSVEVEKVNQGFEDLITQADLVFVSKEVSKANGAKNLEEVLKVFASKLRPKSRLICTWSDQGASGIDEFGKHHFVEAQKVEKIIDTCGAGDTFTAVVISSLIKGTKFEMAIETGCKIAAKKISQKGFTHLFS